MTERTRQRPNLASIRGGDDVLTSRTSCGALRKMALELRRREVTPRGEASEIAAARLCQHVTAAIMTETCLRRLTQERVGARRRVRGRYDTGLEWCLHTEMGDGAEGFSMHSAVMSARRPRGGSLTWRPGALFTGSPELPDSPP